MNIREQLPRLLKRRDELKPFGLIHVRRNGISVFVDPEIIAVEASRTNRGVSKLLNEIAIVCLNDPMPKRRRIGEKLANLLDEAENESLY